MDYLDLQHFLPYHLVNVSDNVSKALSKVYAKHGLTIPEWRIMLHLYLSGSLSHSQLSERANMEKARVSRGLSLMYDKALIRRVQDAVDKRVFHIELTASGKELYQQLEPDVLTWNQQLIEKIGEEETQILLRILKKANVL